MCRRAVGGAVDRAVVGVKTAVCGRRVVAELLIGSATKGVEGENAPVLTVAASGEALGEPTPSGKTPPESPSERKPPFAVAASLPSLWSEARLWATKAKKRRF